MNFAEVNGTALRYDLLGSGAATLVLIHEMGGTIESWDLVAPMLSTKRRVLRYDTRGAGLSQKIRPPLAIDSMVDDLVALLDALGIAGKVALAGIAVGGAIALHTAALCPQRVAAAVVSSPAIGVASDRHPALLARVEKMEREGLQAVIDTLDLGYPPELRDNAQRFAAFRARWVVTRSAMALPHARWHGPCARAPADRLPSPGHCRHARSHPSATAGRAGGTCDFRRALRRTRHGTLCADTDARTIRPDGR